MSADNAVTATSTQTNLNAENQNQVNTSRPMTPEEEAEKCQVLSKF